jgi:beta-lactam-binding protein with PASTA domain
MTSGPAAATLQAAGLRPFIVTYESQQRSDCDGGATGQVPAGGTQVLRDSEVTVEIPFVPDGPILGHICN